LRQVIFCPQKNTSATLPVKGRKNDDRIID